MESESGFNARLLLALTVVRNMKEMILKEIISCCCILFMTFCSCTDESSQNVRNEAERTTSPWIEFPYVSVDTFYVNKQSFRLSLIDSTPFANPVLIDQYTGIHALQAEPNFLEFETMTIEIQMPNRPDGNVSFDLTNNQFQFIVLKYSNQLFKEYVRELLTLNNSTAHKYRENWQSLLDRLNMIFGNQIELKYKEQFPENSTWYGYNSFEIFGLFFQEVSMGKEGVGHKLINSIEGKNKYLFEEDIKSINSLIDKYKKKIEENTAHNNT